MRLSIHPLFEKILTPSSVWVAYRQPQVFNTCGVTLIIGLLILDHQVFHIIISLITLIYRVYVMALMRETKLSSKRRQRLIYYSQILLYNNTANYSDMKKIDRSMLEVYGLDCIEH